MAQEHYSISGRGPELIAVYSFFAALTTITVALRIYVRVRVVKNFGLDDGTAVLGWLIFVFHSGSAIAGAHHGTGQHANLIQPPWELPIALKWWWVCEPLYVAANMAVKFSIALMLLRVFSVEKSYRLLIYIVTGVIQIYSVVFFFLFVFQCVPASFFWTRFQGVREGHCMDPNITVRAFYVYSTLTVVCDWMMAILPWFAVRKLQMDTRSKVMVTIVLAMASIASMATIVRLPYISSMANTADFLYSTMDVAVWSCCETGLAITSSCAATLKPLFRPLIEHSSSSGSNSKSVPLRPKLWDKDGMAKHGGSYIRAHSAGPSIERERKSSPSKDITKTSEVSVTYM